MAGAAWTGRGRAGFAVLALATAAPSPAPATAADYRSGPVYASVSPTAIVLGNQAIERRWDRASFRTLELRDKQGQDRVWSRERRDFALRLADGAELGSERFAVQSVDVQELAGGGLRATMRLAAPGLAATRVAEAYPGIAGLRMQTTLEPTLPLVLAGATLDEAAIGDAAATIHAFRAGADWREPGWEGPPLSVGDPHAGTWRDSRSAGRGDVLDGPAQWLSAEAGGRTLFMVAERNDFPSSRAAYNGRVARLDVDYGRDALVLGPFEEDAHAENPAGEGRTRTLQPGRPFALEAAFTGAGRDADDEAWQFHRYLTERRLAPYDKAVTFNSNGTDSNRISTGAKDDMDYATVQEVAPIAQRLGIETFVLDDGWQAVSGDWEPDSPEHPEPRGDFPPRFPDAEFKAVREAIAPMRLGLWMSPMHFNPASRAYREHPEWACAPVGHALAGANTLQPDDGSNEAGIGAWGPDAIPHVEARIREAIERWRVVYFKFDFLAWIDCAGQGDLYDFHDRFVAMLDRLRADYPTVTFQIDETNDYRLFPFESVTRGPSWFQNGSPGPERLLHNMWNLSPYVPAFSLGQHFLGGGHWRDWPVSTLMAAALPSHLTFFSDLRELPAEVIDEAVPWLEFYRGHPEQLTAGVTYPLLADPLDGGWTALQSWDPQKGEGALLAFRQDSDEETRSIPLRNVPPGRRFDLFVAPDGAYAGSVSSGELAAGLEVTLPEKRGARVLLISPAP